MPQPDKKRERHRQTNSASYPLAVSQLRNSILFLSGRRWQRVFVGAVDESARGCSRARTDVLIAGAYFFSFEV
jgi:hypothetical protein